MKVKLLVSRSGANGAQNRGDIVDVSDDEGPRMIEVGQAEPIRAAVKETAVSKRKVEKAAK